MVWNIIPQIAKLPCVRKFEDKSRNCTALDRLTLLKSLPGIVSHVDFYCQSTWIISSLHLFNFHFSVGANTPVEKHSLNLIQWVGRRQISLEVSSQSTGSVVMQAMFSSVGVYEIQNLNAYVDNQPEGGGLLEKVSLKLPSSHLLCIETPSTVVESGWILFI